MEDKNFYETLKMLFFIIIAVWLLLIVIKL